MTSRLSIACVQVSPDGDRAANTKVAVDAVRRAAREGAQLVTLPEYAVHLHTSKRVMLGGAGREDTDAALAELRAVAKECKSWVLIGSLTIRADEDSKVFNRSYLIADDGVIVARYDKLHMFDVTLPNGRVIRESDAYEAGSRAVLVETPWAPIGLTICYDVRFPQLYRALAQQGAKVIVVPAAFTQATGELNWHALLRARAIENTCYIVAPATCGTHPESHATFGHSLIVDPFGRIILDGGAEPGVFTAEIDLEKVDAARARMPSLVHDRPFVVDVISLS
jgi:predicted amidohydrolase